MDSETCLYLEGDTKSVPILSVVLTIRVGLCT